jgi:hypothetical protein
VRLAHCSKIDEYRQYELDNEKSDWPIVHLRPAHRSGVSLPLAPNGRFLACILM